jgi:hypothetical protein
VREYFDLTTGGGLHWRLPLLEIAFPALKQTPVQQLEFLLQLCRRLVELDGRVDLHEFCMYRILEQSLGEALAPSSRDRGVRASRSEVRTAALKLLSIVAVHGNRDEQDSERAFRAGAAVFGEWAANAPMAAEGNNDVATLERCLQVLVRMDAAATRSLLAALGAAISADGVLSSREAELLRAVCASLHCPLPPLQVSFAPQ